MSKINYRTDTDKIFSFLRSYTLNKKFRKANVVIILLYFSYLFFGCAKIGSPTGGPKDETPPVMVWSEPENYTTNFDGKRVEVEFDEYIQLKNAATDLIISPPLEKKPNVRIKGKGFYFELDEELEENTTYTFNFGNSVVDNNEGNVLENFEFVFSTGDKLDSLTVTGEITDAFTMKPEEEPFFILLHTNLNDTAPLTVIPDFIGRSDKEGNFRINNIREDIFRIFALKDANNNLIYDLPSEKIAFLDSAFRLVPDEMLISDTVLLDTMGMDTTNIDSLLLNAPKTYGLRVNLYSFQERLVKQYLLDYDRPRREQLFLAFNDSLKDSLAIKPLNFSDTNHWNIKESNLSNDTIIYWITDTMVSNMDSLILLTSYQMLDSIDNYYWKQDTLLFRYLDKLRGDESRKKRQKEEIPDEEGDHLVLDINYKNKATIELNGHILFKTPTPIAEIDTGLISFQILRDTVFYPVSFNIEADTVHLRRYHLYNEWEGESSYRMTILPGAFKGIYGLTNDTIEFDYKTQRLDYYGTIILSISNTRGNTVLQLLGKNDKLIREVITREDGEIILDFLHPQVFRLRAIHDTNDNNQWDTGNYLEKIQPEKVEYYEGELNIRSNWEFKVNWELE